MNALFLNFAFKTKIWYIISVYRSPSEKEDELKNFLFSFEFFLCD